MADFSLLKNTAGLVLFTLLLSPTLPLGTASAQVGAEKIPIQPSGKTTEVVERDGNIYSIDKSGKESPLTSSGLDFEPSLSTDQKWVTFVRENPKIMLSPHVADCPDGVECLSPAREIRVMASDGSHDPRLVVSRENFKNGILENFMKPTFSNDNSEIYFLAPCRVTEHAIYAVDVQDSSVRFVTGGSSLDIVRSGFWAGHIIVQKHKYFLGGGSYDWNWLVSPEGRTVAIPLGENRTDLTDWSPSATIPYLP